MMRPSLLQRVLFREMGLTTLICLGGCLCLILLGRLLQLRDLFMGQGVGLGDIASLFLYLSPFFMILLIPVSCMLGLFLTFVRMGTDRELISLRAGGIGYGQLFPAPLCLCLTCTAITMWVSLYGISWGMDNFRQTVMDIAKHKTQITVQPGVFNTGFPGLTIYARQTDPGSGDLTDVFIQDKSRPGMQATILARSGIIDSDSENGQIFVLLQDGHVYRESARELTVASFERYLLTLDMSKLLGGVGIGRKAPKEMSLADLQELALRPVSEIKEELRLKVLIELHKRFALPVACLVLGMFAMPLAFFFQGVKRQFGLIGALGSFFAYYVMISAGVSLAESGVVSPTLAIWLPNVIFLGLAGGAMWLVFSGHEMEFGGMFTRLWPFGLGHKRVAP